ncbi:hypothetical protein NW754_002775 [Fusarium falciforme]|uniref:Uncharacterized protein n=1 Tax=Fusarium falciforme TaxID=195108 RepID=A0A9W8QVF5_9HYPO|nr:Hypothetical protein NCS54_01419400 [Fusarium falciforme]KAJ4172574.1 hypothetical protein NW754_002775 [Fusarium falciforme]KAJ4177658.1 hypothetical protein NW755_013725 [Fusarium falciforme]KAJ4193926.1 hypothetical protein NW767_010166 [Fusarium falciforme]KAJ4243120.1 hypothetical protein NW757_011446 [Fusarium falciforme]WAO96519.1 Hypothetical protein NCS54_01419400 [Fusarium falciforme]
MKVTAAITILAVAANTVMAAPVAPREEAGIFDLVKTGVDTATNIVGTGVNAATSIFGQAFDGATCFVTGFFNIRRPTCGGRAILGNNGGIITTKGDTKGNTNTNVSHESNNDSFSFTYSTEDDGRLKVTITPDAKGKSQCVTIVKKEGEIKEIISREAKKCL